MNNTREALFQQIECPVCGENRYDIIYPSTYTSAQTREALIDVYKSSSDTCLTEQLVACKQCTLVYLNPRVRGDVIIDSYKAAIDPTFIELNRYRITTFKQYLKKIAVFCDLTAAKNTQVLDIGCAGGAFPKAASDLGFSVIGIEPSRWLSEKAKAQYQLDIRPGVLSEQRFEKNYFDLITLWDVIEHLISPREELAQIYQLLKPGGKLVVNFPDYSSIAAKILGRKWPMLLNVHLFYFTPETIGQLLANSGFKVVVCRPFWQTLSLGYIAQRASVYYAFFSQIKKLSELMGVSKLPIKYNIGQTMIIAEKKDA